MGLGFSEGTHSTLWARFFRKPKGKATHVKGRASVKTHIKPSFETRPLWWFALVFPRPKKDNAREKREKTRGQLISRQLAFQRRSKLSPFMDRSSILGQCWRNLRCPVDFRGNKGHHFFGLVDFKGKPFPKKRKKGHHWATGYWSGSVF